MKHIVVIICLFATLGAAAQNSLVLKTQDLPNHNSLIRTWNNDYSIGYTDDDMGQGYFFVENTTNRYLYYVKLRPDARVSDFCVHNDYVYFCGSYEGNPYYGIVGCFDINSVMGGTASINYGLFNTTTYPIYKVRNFIRMDIFEYGGYVHMALVGYLQDASNNIVGTTLCDVYFTGGAWIANYYNGPVGIGSMDYLDIAASSEYVVATSKVSTSNDYMVSVYRVSANYLNSPLSPGTKFQLFGDTPFDNILVEDVGPNSFMLAYYYDSLYHTDTEFGLISVDGANSTIVPQYYCHVPHGVSTLQTSKMHNLHYDYGTQKLLLLQSLSCNQYGGSENVVFEYDVSNPVAGYILGSYIHGIQMNDIDEMINGYYQTIGTDVLHDSLFINHEINATSHGCRELFEMPQYIFPLTSRTMFFPEVLVSPLVPYISIPVSIVKVELDTYCEY